MSGEALVGDLFFRAVRGGCEADASASAGIGMRMVEATTSDSADVWNEAGHVAAGTKSECPH